MENQCEKCKQNNAMIPVSSTIVECRNCGHRPTIDKISAEQYGEANAARVAFDKAIASGRLSDNPNKWNYAGDYMYMGIGAGDVDQFKHRLSREYIGGVK